MARSHPFIEVTVNGKPVSGAFYSRLVSARICDAPGQKADTVDLTFDDAGNEIEMPPNGALIVVRFGFRDFGASKMGVFTVEKPTISGGPHGEFLNLSGRSADMRSDVKEPLSEHFDDQTLGQITEALAARHGYRAKVDQELASIQLPYTARVGQSAVDFLTRLADRFGALFSVKDQTFLLLRRGAFLPPITIHKHECESWEFEFEPRPQYGSSEAGWFDRSKGKVTYETYHGTSGGPRKRMRVIYPTEKEAGAAARSETERLGRATGSGSLTLGGRPEIMADAPLITAGFRPEVNGQWSVAGVDHVYEETYMTTIKLEAPSTGKT
jgi:uncharacterized protein